MSRITQFAVRRRSVTLLLAVAVFISGVYAWGSLQQELLPDIEFPIITVIAPYPGSGAADVTEQVTKPIERAISGVQRLTNLQSTSANSISLVVAQFSYGTDVKETRAAIEQNLATVGLPQGVSPQVNALNINQQPVIIASISGTGDAGLDEAARLARTDIVPALQGLDGVGAVDVTGGLEQRLHHHPRPGQARQRSESRSSRSTGVLAANNLTLPAGQLGQDGTNLPVSTTNQFDVDRADRRPGRRRPDAEPARPGASPTPGASPAPAASALPVAPDADHDRRARHRRAGRRRHDRLCPDRWPARRDAHRLKTSGREHRQVADAVQAELDGGPGPQPRHPDPHGRAICPASSRSHATASSARAAWARCSRS